METIASSELAQLRLFADPHAADKLKRERERGNELRTQLTKSVSEIATLTSSLATTLEKAEALDYMRGIVSTNAAIVSARLAAEEALSRASDICSQIDTERALMNCTCSVLAAGAKSLIESVSMYAKITAISKREQDAVLREAALNASIATLKCDNEAILNAALVEKQLAVAAVLAEKVSALNEQKVIFEEQMKEASVVAAVTKQSREEKAKAASEAKLDAERKANEAQKMAKQLQDEVERLRNNADAQRSVSKSSALSVNDSSKSGKRKATKSKKRKANELEESFQEVIEFISSPPAAEKVTAESSEALDMSKPPTKKPTKMRKLGAIKKKTLKVDKDPDGGESEDSDDKISTALLSKNALEASKPFAQKKPKVPAGGKRSLLVIPDDDAERAGRLSLGTRRLSSSPPHHVTSSSITATAAVSIKKAALSARKTGVSTTAVVVAAASSASAVQSTSAPAPITINIGASSMPAFKLPGGIPAFKMPSRAPVIAPVLPVASGSGAGRLELDSASTSGIPGALMARPTFKIPKLK
jgi:hypothetical protein